MRHAVIALWLITSAALSVGQVSPVTQTRLSVPNLSGNWELDKSMSKLLTKDVSFNSGWTITVSITHNEPEIRIIQKTNWKGKEKSTEFVYYTDGRGETNPAPGLYTNYYGPSPASSSPRMIESRSRWKSEKVQTKYFVTMQFPNGRQRINVEEEWDLSPDGKTLVQTTSFSADTFVRPTKLKKVFNRTS